MEAVTPRRGRPRKEEQRKTPVTKENRLDRVAGTVSRFSELPNDARVGSGVVDSVFGVSNSTRQRWVKAGFIPQPTVIGRLCFWRVGDLRQALAGGVQ